MKQLILLIIALSGIATAQAQFHNSGACGIIPQKKFVLGISPHIMLPVKHSNLFQSSAGSNVMLGLGLSDYVDLRIKVGALKAKTIQQNENDTANSYYYAEMTTRIELFRAMSRFNRGLIGNLELGVHSWQALAGFDGKLNLSYRANKRFAIYSGGDLDYNVELTKTDNSDSKRSFGLYVWVPAGMEFKLSKYSSFNIETSIPVFGDAAFYAGFGFETLLTRK